MKCLIKNEATSYKKCKYNFARENFKRSSEKSFKVSFRVT